MRQFFPSIFEIVQIHRHNKDVHKNLYRNKNGIQLNCVENLPNDYKRPPGFSLVPTLLNASMQNKCIDSRQLQSQYRQQQQHQLIPNSSKAPNAGNVTKSTATTSSSSSQILYGNSQKAKHEMSR